MARVHVKDLTKTCISLAEALDFTNTEAGLGTDHYEKTKALTLRFQKRANEFNDLQKMWSEKEKEKKPAEDEEDKGDEVKRDDEYADTGVIPTAPVNDSIQDIKTDKDLAVVIMSAVHEIFWNPYNGFWSEYDENFSASSYHSLGKVGWFYDERTPEREAAREPIYKKRNLEVMKILKSEFAIKTVNQVFHDIELQIGGVKRRDIRHAVFNHIRFHLTALIFGKDL
eukprot:TRINITY_DN2244_c0_g1_i1.p1 TRINITY_DN2244_c0_g1~~TRINITY_DN2244_c0_g1_i1.p1  ORF type:complete len:226 (+),score=47.73 TRINITY_DN2244_c0_g1_i1:52-729(+)